MKISSGQVPVAKQSIEIADKDRFEFGENWSRFLQRLTVDRIIEAEASLKKMLSVDTLQGHRFLDVGCGSGIFSLAARRLGADVSSFDYDPRSVACTEILKQRYFKDDFNWVVQQGSVLDSSFLERLGQFDVVYAWGVLHHTGAMWQALENVQMTVKPGGRLFVSLYNDQRLLSKYWKRVKRIYNRGTPYRLFAIAFHLPYFCARLCARALTGRLSLDRGMLLWRDMIDWLGGYPFEVAKPDDVMEFFQRAGFLINKSKTCGRRHGCNEFVFQHSPLGGQE